MDHKSLPAEDVFAQLSPEDEQRLISLPYRVGLFVSFADVTGGWDAQEQELQSLTGILRQFSEDHYKTDFCQKLLMETLQARARWPSWSQSIDHVPDEAQSIMHILTSMFDEKEMAIFKEILIDIALAVAMAFREHDREDASETAAGVKSLLAKLVGARTQSDPLEHMNISISEKSAVLRLANALQYTKLQRQ